MTHVHVFGIDNALCKVVDPYFFGFAETKDYDITCKYVAKVNYLLLICFSHIFRLTQKKMWEYIF